MMLVLIILLLSLQHYVTAQSVVITGGFPSGVSDICRYTGTWDICDRFTATYNGTYIVLFTREVNYDYIWFGASSTDNDFARGYEYYHCMSDDFTMDTIKNVLLNPSDPTNMFSPSNVVTMDAPRWGVDVPAMTVQGVSAAIGNQIQTQFYSKCDSCQDYWAAVRRGWIWAGYAIAGLVGAILFGILIYVAYNKYN